MSHARALAVACGQHDRVLALRAGLVRPLGVELAFTRPGPAATTEADVREMPLLDYLMRRVSGDDEWVAIPVFLRRGFVHRRLFVRDGAEIGDLRDIEGRVVVVDGVDRGELVWLKGLLADESGIDPSAVHWIEDGSGDGVGEAEAAVSARPPEAGRGRYRRWFDWEDEKAYYEETGLFPIHSVLVLRSGTHRRERWFAESIYDAFIRAKEWCVVEMHRAGATMTMLPWQIDAVEELDTRYGDEMWDDGLRANRPELEMFARYMTEQGLCGSEPRVDEVFAPVVEAVR